MSTTKNTLPMNGYKMSSGDIQDEIYAAKKRISVLKESSNNDMAAKLWLSHEIGHVKYLEEQHKAALFYERNLNSETKRDGEVVFKGDGFDSHQVEARFLVRFVDCFEKMVCGLSSVGGPNGLRLNTRPGSLVIEFTLIQPEDSGQLAIEPPVNGAAILADILDINTPFSDIVNIIEMANIDRQYREMMKLMSDNDINMEYRTKERQFGARINSVIASDRYFLLNKIVSEKKDSFTIIGELRYGSVDGGTCMIQSSSEKWRVRVPKNKARIMRGIELGASVRAVVNRTLRMSADFPDPIVRIELDRIETLTNSQPLPYEW